MASGQRVLIVDDDNQMRESLAHLLQSAGFETDALPRAEAVAGYLRANAPDVLLCDVRMPGRSGLDLLRELKGEGVPPIVLISAHGDIPMAVTAMQDGAYSFLEKPFEPRRLIKVLRNAAALHRLSRDTERLKARLKDLSGVDRLLIGRTAAIERLRQDIIDLSDSDTTIMLLGETGTGKELVARALHDLGPRASGPFVPVNCAAVPMAQFEEILFGTAAGSKGLLSKADGGTLFLDELGAIPLEAQAKLLRVIETRQFVPLGSATTMTAEFRVLSASNDRLDEAVAEGRFREDLYYRLNTVVLTLPTLRGRRDDIPVLYAHFLGQYASLYEIEAPEVTSDDLAALMSHDWPGNVRELRNVSERRVLAARRGMGSAKEAIQVSGAPEDVPETLREAVAAFERQLIGKAISTHKGRMDAVAEALGIARRTLNEKIVKLGLVKDELL